MPELSYQNLQILGLSLDLIGFIILSTEVYLAQRNEFRRVELVKLETEYQDLLQPLIRKHIISDPEISSVNYEIHGLTLADYDEWDQTRIDELVALEEKLGKKYFVNKPSNDIEWDDLEAEYLPRINSLKSDIAKLHVSWLPVRRVCLVFGIFLIVTGFCFQIISFSVN